MSNNYSINKISFVASQKPAAQEALRLLQSLYGVVSEEDSDAIVAIGGDGLMLETLRRQMNIGLPVFGLNCGTIGFLMNEYSQDKLLERINSANAAIIHPLAMSAIDTDGVAHTEYAINEVSLLRQTHQTAHLNLEIDEKPRLDTIICDGIIIATSAGSTAYNLSAHGPIIPIGTGLLALTPISVFRPRRWRGALLRDNSLIRIIVQDPVHRPVAASADNNEIRNIREVQISMDKNKSMVILFDKDRTLDDRVLTEQFAV